MAHSLLLIPVPELEAVVRPRLARRSPEYLSPDTDEVAAHITLLGPFADIDDVDDGIVSELRSFFADVTPFVYRLTAISQFPGGAIYLTPEPAAPFRRLTLELYKRFPEFPPYAGEFDDVIPHLTIPVPDDEDVDTVRFELRYRLPVSAYARDASLFWWEPGNSRTLVSFPFGTTAA